MPNQNDESWEAQRVHIAKTLDRFELLLNELESKSTRVITDIAVLKAKWGMMAGGVAIAISLLSNLAIYIIKGGL